MLYSISREAVKVIIFVPSCRIEGNIHLPHSGRISDFLASQTKKFFPVTEAKVFSTMPRSEKFIYKTPFMTVNKRYVITLIPRGKWEKLNAKA